MRQTTLIELAWIHDCDLLGILYDFGQEGRSIKLSIRCPTDLEYAPWEGKDLVLAAIDVALSRHVMWGVAGPESIDAIRPGVSAAARESTLDARRRGIRFPSIELSISFHSGSSLEVICERLEVDVGSGLVCPPLNAPTIGS